MRWLAVVICLGGCSVGDGTGSVTGSLFINQCTDDTSYNNAAFDLHASFFTADPVNDLTRLEPMNRVSIRLQSGGNLIEEADVLYIAVSDVEAVAKLNGTPVTVGPNTITRANLSLKRTCPQISVEMELDGTITFSQFGSPDPDGVIRHIYAEDPLVADFAFNVIDRRASTLGGIGNVTGAPDVGGEVHGNFDFIVKKGRAAQQFP